MTLDDFRGQFPQYNDMSDGALANALHSKYYSNLNQADFAKQIGVDPSVFGGNTATQPTSIADKALSELQGGAEGVYNFGQGVVQAGLKAGQALGAVDPQTVNWYTNNIAKTRAAQQANNPEGQAGRIVGQALPLMALPGIGGATGLVGKLLGSAAVGAVAGAVQPTGQGTPTTGQNIAVGAAGGLLGGVVGSAIPAATRALFTNAPQDIDAAMASAKQAGIDLTPGQITGNKTLQGLESAEQNIPIVGSLLNNTGKVQGAALKDYTEQLIGTKTGITDLGAKLQADVIAQKQTITDQSTALYNKFLNLAAQGGAKVPLTQTALTLDQEASRLSGLENISGFADPSAVNPAIQRVQQMQQSLQQILAKDGTVTPDVLKQLRSAVMATGKDTTGEELKTTSAVGNALQADLGSFAQNSGNPALFNAYRDASNFYKNSVVPYTADSQLAKLSNIASNPDKIFSTFIKNDAPATSGKLVDNLSDDGKTLVQTQALSKAFQSATDVNGVFSPVKFQQNIDKLGETQGVIFSSDMQQKLQGLSVLIKTAAPLLKPTDLAGAAGGAALGVSAGAAGALAHPGLPIILGALAAAGRSSAATSALIKASRFNVGSPAAQRAIASIVGLSMSANQESN